MASIQSDFLANFGGRWRRPSSDYQNAIRSYLIVMDTNVLLQLYRFTPGARKELFEVLDKVKDRLWIPHQVASEYYDNRLDAVKEHLELYTKTSASIESLKVQVAQEINRFAKRSSISPEDKSSLLDPIESAFNKVENRLKAHQSEFDLSLEIVVDRDPILERLALMLHGRIGDPFPGDEVDGLIAEFEKRADNKTPPGYKDASKSENAHGDFFVWEQTLRKAAETRNPVILVTNDEKEDWVLKQAGLTVGARPELIAEMQKRAEVDFLLAPLSFFLSNAKVALGATVSDSTVAQAVFTQNESRVRRNQVNLTAEEYAFVDQEIRSDIDRYDSYIQRQTTRIAASIEKEDYGTAERAERMMKSALDDRGRAAEFMAAFVNVAKTFDGYAISLKPSERRMLDLILARKYTDEGVSQVKHQPESAGSRRVASLVKIIEETLSAKAFMTNHSNGVLSVSVNAIVGNIPESIQDLADAAGVTIKIRSIVDGEVASFRPTR